MTSGAKITNEVIATRVATATTTADSSTFTAETQVATVTAYLVSGRTYAVEVKNTRWSSSVAADTAAVRLREDSVSGTQMNAMVVGIPTTTTSGFGAGLVYAEFTAGVTGNKTFSLTGSRNSGTGNIQLRASATAPTYLTVTLIPT